MRFEQVFERFSALTGLDYDSASKWQWLCCDAINEYNQKVSRRITDESSLGRLSAAAAALAFYKYSLLNCDDGIDSFKAGDVTIGFSKNKLSNALDVWRQADKAARDLLDDGNFFFRKVKS